MNRKIFNEGANTITTETISELDVLNAVTHLTQVMLSRADKCDAEVFESIFSSVLNTMAKHISGVGNHVLKVEDK